jgi:hypothetical protein
VLDSVERKQPSVHLATYPDGLPDLRKSAKVHRPETYAFFDRMTAHWCSTPDPVINKAASKDPDLYTWDEAMASQYRVEFLDASGDEIDALVGKETWFEDLKSNATTKIIPSQWVFRVKRTASGEVKKFKARLVLRGDLQEYEGETFSPVAAWSTVRTFLVVSSILEWTTVCIDFSNAFVQSPLPEDEPVWMHLPRGYKSTNGDQYCLKLKKSLYGHKVAPLLWFKHVGKAFKKLGLRQSKHDPCLWYGDDIILVQYVDDCGITAPNMERIDKFIADLEADGLQLTKEETFNEFLGIKFERDDNGTYTMTQSGLIRKILTAAGMEDCNPNAVPASQAALGANKDGEPMTEKWNYRGIVGMLLYLSTNTRPDIAFAVSQVARFSNDPKKSHATAVKTILRYLKGTMHKGTKVSISDLFALDLYVDADFCGLYGREDDRDPNSVRSRTGWIIMLNNWPILWKSHLQTQISQSTLEAEYSALSSALKIYLPLKLLVEEIVLETNCRDLQDRRVIANVFEDNAGAYFLATNHKITNRTKYFLAKWHWFWDAFDRKEFNIQKCATHDQRADYLTKALTRELFEANRLSVQGW